MIASRRISLHAKKTNASVNQTQHHTSNNHIQPHTPSAHAHPCPHARMGGSQAKRHRRRVRVVPHSPYNRWSVPRKVSAAAPKHRSSSFMRCRIVIAWPTPTFLPQHTSIVSFDDSDYQSACLVFFRHTRERFGEVREVNLCQPTGYLLGV
jgi:hypothetical protein